MNQLNTFTWITIPVKDLDRAVEFYSAILNSPVQKKYEQGFEFGLLPHKEGYVSGCLAVMNDRQPSQNGPLVYLNVEGHLDKSISAAKKKGGEVLKEKEPIEPHGYRAIILDTEGNAIALHSKEI